MADESEELLTPENLCINPRSKWEPLLANPNSTDDMAHAEAQNNNEPCVAKVTSNMEPIPCILEANRKDHDKSDDIEGVHGEIAVKSEPDDEGTEEEVKIKEEFEEGNAPEERPFQNCTGESPLLGKLKVKSMASLVETTPPNPQPILHPFFAGFDDHIRSLIINRQPQFTMPALLQQPGRFMYYDNSTNMNLKKMINGHKMAQIPAPRHQYRPYVPINVPRPPRAQPFRTSFSTQTPPMFMGSNVGGTPSTSYQWLPQSRPPVPNFTPLNKTTQSVSSVRNFSSPAPPKFSSPQPIQHPHNSKFFKSPAPTLNPPYNAMNSVTPQSIKVSTSSSTDDLENHSSENAVTIKTEIDLGIDTKEELHSTLGTDLINSSESVIPTQDNVNPTDVATAEPQHPILTGDVVTPVNEPPKRNPAYELPAYSTKGWLLCKCCDFRCNRRKKMKEHFDTMHTAENQFKCFYCIKQLTSLVYHKSVHDLEHHVAKVHRGEKRWQCKVCSKTYKCHASLKAHRSKTCSQSNPYACHMCTFTCKTETSLEKHIKSHEKIQETEQCPFCNKTFKKFYIKTHLVTVHAPPEEKPFHCDLCDYAAGTQSALDNHYKRSGHDKKFKCNHCGYACRSHAGLKNHIKNMHSDLAKRFKRLVCGVEGCSVRCLSEKTLMAHRRLHSLPDSELFICPDKDCSRKFLAKRLLQLHLGKTAHHKPFKCTDCSLRFLKEESVNHHIQSFHVDSIMKKMEKSPNARPICVKNVVDVYNWVGGAGSLETQVGTIGAVENFGCWLGISGFGDIRTDCDNQELSEAAVAGVNIEGEGPKEEKIENEESDQESNVEEKKEDDDDDFQTLLPITCLVEVKQEDNELEAGNPCSEEVFLKTEEEDDSEYQYVNPNLSNLVECQQNPTTDSSTGDNENPEAINW